jgi:DNA-binding HxlR family transcriptional regulator
MQWDVYNERCPTRILLDRVADKWTVLVVGALEEKTKRFGQLRREIGGVSQKMLTQTLRQLERDGVVCRRVYASVPPKVEYSLTELGLSLVPVLATVKREGKGKKNVMYCLHTCLDHAWRSGRIPAMPAFPKEKDYQIVQSVIQWLPEERQRKVIEAIPIEHQPIFWWLKYHLRRPAEAMALRKEDFDGGMFTVHRGFSAKVPLDRTKTGEIHAVPMVSDFEPFIEIEEQKQKANGIISHYFFRASQGEAGGQALYPQDHERPLESRLRESG